MARDQNSLTPFVQCEYHGDANGFVEPAFHTGMVGRPDGDGEVNSRSYGCLPALRIEAWLARLIR